MKSFKIVVFEFDSENSKVVENNLPLSDAINKAESLFDDNDYHGVVVQDEDINSLQPTQWVKGFFENVSDEDDF